MDLDAGTRSAVRAASIAELAWLAADGRPRVEGVLPLLLDGAPALAFTYADHGLAVEVSAAHQVVVTVTEPRSTGTAFRPLAIAGRPRLRPDPEGELFVDDLLPQELRRYPPSRALADSPLLRRENWWYLPRMIVPIDVDTVSPVPARGPLDGAGGGDHLLVVAAGGGLEVQVVDVPMADVPGSGAADVGPITVTAVGAEVPATGRASLFGQDASFPDLERWSQWEYRGQWDPAASRFTATELPRAVGLEPVPSLLRRWRRQRDLERRCRKTLAEYS